MSDENKEKDPVAQVEDLLGIDPRNRLIAEMIKNSEGYKNLSKAIGAAIRDKMRFSGYLPKDENGKNTNFTNQLFKHRYRASRKNDP